MILFLLNIWKRNFKLVKEMLLQAEVYVYESDQKIQGFIGLNNDYIEGIFVSDKMQSQGIGKILLNDTKDKRNELRLNVYRKNTRAISFYQREGLEIQSDGLDEATGEKDYVMVWKKKSKIPFAELRKSKSRKRYDAPDKLPCLLKARHGSSLCFPLLWMYDTTYPLIFTTYSPQCRYEKQAVI